METNMTMENGPGMSRCISFWKKTGNIPVLAICDRLPGRWYIFSSLIPFFSVMLSNEKNPGWLGYIGDYTIQLYRDYNKPL